MKTVMIGLLLASIVLGTPSSALAVEDGGGGTNQCAANEYQLGVPLGGIRCVPKGTGAFRAYVIALYKYIIVIAVILAAIVSTWGGYLWMTSGGDPTRINSARELIIGALSGLALLLLASTVMRFIGIGG